MNATNSVALSHRHKRRPKGFKNKPKTVLITANVTDVNEPTNTVNSSYFNDEITHAINETRLTEINKAFLTAKEKYDYKLSLILRTEGKITTSGKLFEVLDQAEIAALIEDGVFRFEQYDSVIHISRLFNSRLVREIKNKETKPYEKSRLVIQGFNDSGKAAILTQALII